MPSLLEQRIYP